MKTIIITAILLSIFLGLSAANPLEGILREVEKNNTGLQALKQEMEARGLASRTGIYPADPKAEFNYLWGNPAVMGNRINLALTQSFDFPTSYIHRNRIADARSGQLQTEYNRQLTMLFYEVRLIAIELIHRNALSREYKKRTAHAMSLRDSYKAMLEEGEAGLPAYNKAELNLLNIRKEAEINDIERNRLLSELAALNGGREIAFDQSDYPPEKIPEDFDRWYSTAEQHNPVLQWLAGEQEISNMQENLNKALSLPSFHTGYMSTTLGAQQFRGITAGITIPLWENRNKVRHARAQTLALQSAETDNKLRFHHQLESAHAKAIALQASVAEYRRLLNAFDNTNLLAEALEEGEISLTKYILELTVYYDSTDNLMETELEMHKAIAELFRYQGYYN